METFNYCLRPGVNIDNEPKRNVVDFGDGYSQRSPKGLNFLLRKISAVVKVKKAEAVNVDAFFSRHGGVDPFYIHDPITNAKRKVICSKWPAAVKQNYVEFNCEFEEVP